MADVAREAGVSVATVSKVVNGRYGVAQSTLEHVLTVIDDLGYEASLGARSLRSLRTNVIGVLVAEFEPFSTELLKGVSAAIGETSYELIAYAGRHHGDQVGWERRSLVRLGGSVIDGAIVVTPTVVDASSGGIPIVAVDPHTGPSDVPTVDSDNYEGAMTATRHLLSLGHTRIGFLGGRTDLESAQLREKGFRDAMRDAGVPVDDALVVVGGFRPESAEAPARQLLERADRPSAVFAANDLTAIRTMEVARGLGLSVPDDLSVIGFDNVPESALSQPPLTTISQPLQEMGSAALRMLVSLLDGVEPEPSHVRLPTTMVERGTCRAV
jgi:LacI family transcriptional regulator, galactose operon repressor